MPIKRTLLTFIKIIPLAFYFAPQHQLRDNKMTSAKRPIFNLELDLLRTFVAVADGSTFAAAAESVCRTQSAVSQQMQRLESLIGKELCSTRRNKTLTEAGTQLLNYAQQFCALMMKHVYLYCMKKLMEY